MRRLLTALLMVLLVSASSCDGRSDAFDFSTDHLCEWFSGEEIDTIVATAYEDNDASPLPPAYQQAWASDAYSGCAWGSEGISKMGLIATEPVVHPATDARDWQPHPALSDGVFVDQEVVVGSHGDWEPGVEVRLLVESQELTVEFWHGVPPGFDGDADALLAIANAMLEQMGWVPVPSR